MKGQGSRHFNPILNWKEYIFHEFCHGRYVYRDIMDIKKSIDGSSCIGILRYFSTGTCVSVYFNLYIE